jgi:hypothetical protein
LNTPEKTEDETVVMKSNLLDHKEAREYVTTFVQGKEDGSVPVTRVEISSEKWSAVIKEHASKDSAWKRFIIECRNTNNRFMTVYLQSRSLNVFRLLEFTKFFKRAMDINVAMVLIKGDTEEITNAEEIDDSDSKGFPFVFQCPNCGKKFKTSAPDVQVF